MPQLFGDNTTDLTTLFHSMKEGVGIFEIIHDSSGNPCDYRIQYANPTYCTLMDITMEHSIGKLATEVFNENKIPFLTTYARVSSTGTPETLSLQYPPHGKYANASVISLGKGKLATVFSDSDERDDNNREVRQTETIWKTITLNAPDQIIVIDPDFHITFANHMLCGTAPEAAINTPLSDHVPPDAWPDIKACLERVVKTGRPDTYVVTCKNNEDASPVSIEGRVRPVYHNNNILAHLLIYATDITDKKNKEEQQLQNDTLCAISRLAGGIAHDFNNQLTGIIGNADLLLDEFKDNGPIAQYVNDILTASKKTTSLTSQLLAFSRQGKYQNTKIFIHEMINEIAAGGRFTGNNNITIVRNLNATSDTIIGDPLQIRTVIENVVQNARDAIETEHGKIILTTELRTLDKEYCDKTLYEINPGSYIEISVTDTGKGVSEKVRRHMFEPFFTTKKTGQKTGMGLSSAYGIIKLHKGAIHVTGSVGHGTTVTMYLPLSESPQMKIHTDTKITSNNAGHILLVDDEELIRIVGGNLLNRLGFSVTTCSDGFEAVEIFRKKSKVFDLVILDIIMPVMGGKETFLEMKRMNPNVAVLLSSGYSIRGDAEEIITLGAKGFIQKPYRKAELAKAISQLYTPC